MSATDAPDWERIVTTVKAAGDVPDAPDWERIVVGPGGTPIGGGGLSHQVLQYTGSSASIAPGSNATFCSGKLSSSGGYLIIATLAWAAGSGADEDIFFDASVTIVSGGGSLPYGDGVSDHAYTSQPAISGAWQATTWAVYLSGAVAGTTEIEMTVNNKTYSAGNMYVYGSGNLPIGYTLLQCLQPVT